MNKFICIGNLTREPELKYIPASGLAVCKFGIAINEGYGDKKRTDFLNCTAFGKTAENIASYTDKGSKVLIDGKIQTGSYKNKEGINVYTTDVIVNFIEFLSKKEVSDIPPDDEDIFQPVDDDEEIPF
jgi:single-strand DNA-binding protein